MKGDFVKGVHGAYCVCVHEGVGPVAVLQGIQQEDLIERVERRPYGDKNHVRRPNRQVVEQVLAEHSHSVEACASIEDSSRQDLQCMPELD